MKRFNDIADRVLDYDPQADLGLLQRAYVYSAKVHEGQERLSGEPYLVHPLEVAGILTEMRLDAVTIAAGLLHDTLEDTLTSAEEIRRLFGEEVAFIVEGLTKISKIEFTSARVAQAENFRRMLLAMSKDIRILLIKLADRLHNMRTLKYMSDDSRLRVAQETSDIYVPLAHRLGINWMKQELEELSFQMLKPRVAEELERQLKVSRKARERYIEEVIGILSTKLAKAGLAAEVTGRVKELASIHHKMEKQGITVDQIYDLVAFRVILDARPEAVYTALGIVHQTWRPVPGRLKDYVALPKPNGYQSLHCTVIGPYGERMEVQIRTVEMHRAAEFGLPAHWKYKEGRVHDEKGDDTTFAWLRQLLEWQRELDDPHEFIDTVKVDLFPDEVFVFTPKGDVVGLPRGSTPIDFAYAIHTEVGNHCSGSRVNGKQVPLRHVLEDGDTVEVRTSTQQVPRKDWLEFVVSGKARSRIRHAVREAENESSRELGRGILERELKKAGFSLNKLISGGELADIAQQEARGGVNDLLAQIGYGRKTPAVVLRRLREEEVVADAEPEPAPEGRRRLFFRRERPATSKSGIRVSGHSDVMVRFGQCCVPLPGDEVVGYVTRGRGVTVHAKDCRKVFELDPERRIDVDWDPESAAPRRIRIRVETVDQPGILANVTKTISAAKINIGAARIDTHDDTRATLSFDLWVTDVRSLNGLMKEIDRLKGVFTVERVRA